MKQTALDVLGIGNALVDVLARGEDSFLERHGLEKGSMTLIGDDQAKALYEELGPAVEVSGGSAANTIAGVASFGGTAAYTGKVADDALGDIFVHDIKSIGVTFETPRAEGLNTGRCLILVTPDAHRTMSTYLGASTTLSPLDLDAAQIQSAGILYLEGYLFDPEPARAAFYAASAIAHEAGRKVALTLSDSFCVERYREEFQHLVETQVDLLFANEDEIKALYQVETFDEALQIVRQRCEIAALTRSEKGSVIVAGDEVHVVDAAPVDTLVDTTGAGDLYAAGFMTGLAQGRDLMTCGRLASLAAAEVISHFGARPEHDLKKLAAEAGLL